MALDIQLDSAAFDEILKVAMREPVIKAAEAMADHVRAQGIKVSHGKYDLPVKVVTHVSDRIRAVVMITHPAAVAVEAKYGALTKAAAAQGLEVTEK